MRIEEVQKRVVALTTAREDLGAVSITARFGETVETNHGNEATILWDIKVDEHDNVTVQKQGVTR